MKAGKNMSKANKAQSKPQAPKADAKPIDQPKAPNGDAQPQIRSMEAITADIKQAMGSGDIEKLQQLFAEKAKADKLEAKAKADYVKANAEKFTTNRITFASYINDAVTEAIKAFEAENGSTADFIGDKLTAIRYTLAGVADKSGVVSNKPSTALLTAAAKKASNGIRVGNFNAGERGNVWGSGMTLDQIIAKFGSEAEQAEYEAMKPMGKATNSKRYTMAIKLLKANGYTKP